MKNTNGNPDILVTFEHYRFFIVKDGKPTAMKVKYNDGEIGVTTIGRLTKPYIMQDGTIAIPNQTKTIYIRRKIRRLYGGIYAGLYKAYLYRHIQFVDKNLQ